MKFPVSLSKEEALLKRLESLGIREEDLDEHFVASGGPGGQNLNKTATCVVLLHRPTGLKVKCQEERSQGLNRYLARRRLAEKMERLTLGVKSAEEKERYKIRRQKKRRSRKTRQKIREQKEAHSEKKKLRRPPPHE